jgi:hypothetical protein
MLLIPPLPSVGTIGLVLSYIVIVPLAIWDILIALMLFQIVQGVSKEKVNQD